MTVIITVSDVREALYQAAGGAAASGGGSPSLPMLGQWFHEAIGKCVGNDSSRGWLAGLAEVEPDLDVWKQTLVERAYSQFVGPRLTRERAVLHDATPHVVSFWQAVQAACHWLAELSWSARSAQASRSAKPLAPWSSLAGSFATEVPLTCELCQPGWSDNVRLMGIADAVVRLAPSGAWCAIEFKLGQTSPAADLGQACLYHMLLSAAHANGGGVDAGTLALVSFRPQRQERVFAATELAVARQRLLDLIGKLAGVDLTQALPLTRTGPTDGTQPPTMPSARVFTAVPPVEEHLKLGRDLVTALAEYGVNVSLDEQPIVGPTFLRFPITLGRGTRVHAVERHAAELQMRLALKAEPFINRDEGRLVIDVQRPVRQTVWFGDVRSQLPRPDVRLGGSHVPVGVNLSGHLVCADLAKTEHAHLLVAGTTGSGKSEWLRLAIAGLIATNTPETLRLLIIDPKRNAFHSLRESPYLWQPLVFPDEQPAAEVLRELATEMDRRYRQLDGADSHAQLAARSDVPLPRIVCVCDEYRDLISRSRDERKQIEAEICRLGAKARAAGIHLILATQEPRRETIIGPLDANMPARVGLKMGKSLESNMLLGVAGAEKLLGYGDLLFKDIGPPRRLQAPLLSPDERDAIFGGQ